jgi:hypothetical protein
VLCCSAEGRYLAACRDLSQPPLLDQQRVTPAAQWRVTPQGLVNVQHSHKVRSAARAVTADE